MLTMHGASFLGVKTRDAVQNRAKNTSRVMAIVTIVLFALGGFWINPYECLCCSIHSNPIQPSGLQPLIQTGRHANCGLVDEL